MHTIAFHRVKEIDIKNRIHDTFSVSSLVVTDEKGQRVEINLFNSNDVKPLIRSVNGKRINGDRKVIGRSATK